MNPMPTDTLELFDSLPPTQRATKWIWKRVKVYCDPCRRMSFNRTMDAIDAMPQGERNAGA